VRNGAHLEGLRVLVVEDNFLLAMEIEAILRRHGCEILGPAGTVDQALRLLNGAALPDLAVLDVDLQGRRVTPVAAVLRAQGVPYLLVTGYADPQLGDPELQAGPRLDKPVDGADLLHALASLLRR
jgi:two-component system, response regulator PdtaR